MYIKKICTNEDCKACADKKIFKSEDLFCTLCGQNLASVEVKRNKKRHVAHKTGDTVGQAVRKAGKAAEKVAKDAAEMGIDAAEKGVRAIKVAAPAVAKGVKKAADNPTAKKVIKAGAIAGIEYGKSFIKNDGIKKVVNAGLKVLK